jgi:hypothetical protein
MTVRDLFENVETRCPERTALYSDFGSPFSPVSKPGTAPLFHSRKCERQSEMMVRVQKNQKIIENTLAVSTRSA